MKKHKTLLGKIMFLAWPAILQEAMYVVVAYVDTAMVGALGKNASASIGLTASVMWLVACIAGGFGIGVLSVCAQADGSGDMQKRQKAGQQALFLTFMVGIPMTAICLGVSSFLPTILGAEKEIHADASAYFAIISAVYLFRAAETIFSSALRGVSDTRSPMIINLIMNAVNIVLNFLFIYPTREIWGVTVWGADLGVKGAAIASAIAYVVGGCLMFLAYYRNKTFEFRKSGFHYDKKIMGDELRIGVPVVISRSVVCFGYVAFTSIIAKLGSLSLASHSIAIQAEEAFYIPGYGFQSAAATLVGNAIGEKRADKVKKVSYAISAITFSLMLIAGVVLFLFAERLVGIFTPDADVIKLGASVLRIVAVSEPIYGVLVIMEGTFNGMGDTKAPLIYSLITMWGIRIGGSLVLIHVFGMGLQAVWVMMVIDNIARCTLLLQRFVRGKWQKTAIKAS